MVGGLPKVIASSWCYDTPEFKDYEASVGKHHSTPGKKNPASDSMSIILFQQN